VTRALDSLAIRQAFWLRVDQRLSVLDMSRWELGRRVGTGQAWASESFSQHRNPNLGHLIRIAETLKVNLHWLITGQGTPLRPGAAGSDYEAGEAAGRASAITELEAALRSVRAGPGSRRTRRP